MFFRVATGHGGMLTVTLQVLAQALGYGERHRTWSAEQKEA